MNKELDNKKMITLSTGEKMIVYSSQLEEGVLYDRKEFYFVNDKTYIENWLEDEFRDGYLMRYLEKRTKDFGYLGYCLGRCFFKLEKIRWFTSNFKYIFDINEMKFIEVNELLNFRKLWKYTGADYEVVKIEDI